MNCDKVTIVILPVFLALEQKIVHLKSSIHTTYYIKDE